MKRCVVSLPAAPIKGLGLAAGPATARGVRRR